MTEAEASNGDSERARSQPVGVGFTIGCTAVFALMLGGAVGAFMLLVLAFDDVVPDDGIPALFTGGVAGGGVSMLFIALTVIGMVSGTPEHPRIAFREGLHQIAGTLFICVLPAIGSVLPAQAGRLFPPFMVGLLSLVFVVGGFILLGILFPWARLGRGKQRAMWRKSGKAES
ncbi:hypothetical protein [Streptomyces sp. MAR4 CNX-425]|uniref:hypothetical protein n=1 Tax=Streptomyces sp. MAR4 CNX-425 TaxID=3406343 RepID=UPI003B507D31